MPFYQTATLGGSGANVLPPGDVINHFNQVRVRVVGSGTLHGIMYSMDEVSNLPLTDFVMSSTNQNIQRSLTNFIQQRASVKFYTDAIDEVFQITRIVIYSRPMAVEYPA